MSKDLSTAAVVAQLRAGGFSARKLSVSKLLIREGYQVQRINDAEVRVRWRAFSALDRAEGLRRVGDYLRSVQHFVITAEANWLVVSRRFAK